MEILQIDEETARKNLQCLATSKYRILILKKSGSGSLPESQQSDAEMIDTSMPKNSPEDRVMLNHNFSSNLVRLNLPIPALDEVYKKERVV
jgi:hypothetical protein